MTPTVLKPTLLTLDEVLLLMQTVQERSLQHDADELHDNPVKKAVQRIYDRLKDAVRLVSEFGQEKLEEARDLVVEEWLEVKKTLGDAVHEALALFQEMMQRLLSAAFETISGSLPGRLATGDGARLDTVAFRTSIALSPSVAFAATEWLKVAATGGFDVSVSYKFEQPGH